MNDLEQIGFLLQTNKKSLLMTFAVILLIGLIPIFAGFVLKIKEFSENLRSVNSEIRRTSGREHTHYIHLKKRMWISFFFPFVRFRKKHHSSDKGNGSHSDSMESAEENSQKTKKRFQGTHLSRLLFRRIPRRFLSLVFVTLAFSVLIEGAIYFGLFEKAAFEGFRSLLRTVFHAVVFLLYLWFIWAFSSQCFHHSKGNTEYYITSVAIYGIYAGIGLTSYFLFPPERFFWLFRMSAAFSDLFASDKNALPLFCVLAFHLLILLEILSRPLISRLRHKKNGGSEHHHHHHHHHHHEDDRQSLPPEDDRQSLPPPRRNTRDAGVA